MTPPDLATQEGRLMLTPLTAERRVLLLLLVEQECFRYSDEKQLCSGCNQSRFEKASLSLSLELTNYNLAYDL